MTPLERAGKAALSAIHRIFSEDVDLSPKEQAYIARAVLEAIREPSEGMLEQGWLQCAEPANPTDVWEVMIDAALSEG